MGQSPSSVRSKSRQRSFRGFARRSKLNKSSLSHTFSLPPSEEYPELMNVNTATEEQLMTLPGVNRQLAREIVRHRQMIGRFKRVDDLALVSGIGADKLELLRPEICVNTKKSVSRASSCTQSLDSIRLPIENKLCSINSSSVFQLQCVPGLNQEIAANIVDYRNKKGPFKSLDDLIKVRGVDIVRLSAIKQHLSLELRKCESAQNLNNGHVNGIAELSLDSSIPNGVTSTPTRTPHRKSLSMPTKLPFTLPNGFATAPVNDILDLLAAYSHRPIVQEVFSYERDGVRCCRFASWNLHQLTVDKITNPGVREVICRTILENKLSLIAVQGIVEESALRILCEELNEPSLRRVKEWKSNHQWDYRLSERLDGEHLGFIFDTSNNKGVTVEHLDLDGARLLNINEVESLLDQAHSSSAMYDAFTQAFLVSGKPVVLTNVLCKGRLSEVDSTTLQEVAQNAAEKGLEFAFAGEFQQWDNVSALKTCESLLNEEVPTTVDPSTPGKSTIMCPGTIDKTNFNGRSGCIRSGLCHLAIPRGWSWGGPASPYCPIWAEIKVPD